MRTLRPPRPSESCRLCSPRKFICGAGSLSARGWSRGAVSFARQTGEDYKAGTGGLPLRGWPMRGQCNPRRRELVMSSESDEARAKFFETWNGFIEEARRPFAVALHVGRDSRTQGPVGVAVSFARQVNLLSDAAAGRRSETIPEAQHSGGGGTRPLPAVSWRSRYPRCEKSSSHSGDREEPQRDGTSTPRLWSSAVHSLSLSELAERAAFSAEELKGLDTGTVAENLMSLITSEERAPTTDDIETDAKRLGERLNVEEKRDRKSDSKGETRGG